MSAAPLPLFDQLDEDQRKAEQGAHLPPRLTLVKSGPPTTIQEAAKKRDEGIETGLAHADRVNRERLKAEWREWALVYIAGLVRLQGAKPFLAEELIEKASYEGALKPPDGRAWGGIFRSLAKQGLIKSIGTARAKTSNLSHKVLWARVESSDEAVIQNKP